MKPFTIELVKGQKQAFNFQVWKDDGLAFYATNSEGQPAMIEPVSAYPDDSNSGKPYRFPRVSPVEITPKRFKIEWSAHHRDVLRCRRDARFAEIDALPEPAIDPTGIECVPPETSERAKNNAKGQIQREYDLLMAVPLIELFDFTAYPNELDEILRPKWVVELGEDFQAMLSEVTDFDSCWHEAYDKHGEHVNYKEMLSALRSVQFVMLDEDGIVYPLSDVRIRRPTDQETRAFAMMQQLDRGANTQQERKKLEAVVDQLGNKTNELAKTIAPLNKLYSDVGLAEIRKRAKGNGVPELLTDWILGEFMSSDPPRLPTKGDVFNHCGPGTTIGEKLEQAGYGNSKQRLADHLTVIRRLLEEMGWLARRAPGKSRKRESYFRPDERLEDFNQPTPAQSAEDRDEEQQAAGWDSD